MAAGVVVTIATGRLGTGTWPIARDLGIAGPVICADGGFLLDAVTGAVIESTPLPLATVDAALRTLAEHGLTPFVFMHDVIHGEEIGRHHHRLVTTWSRNITLHPLLAAAQEWRRHGEVAQALGIGDRLRVEAARAALESRHRETLTLAHFGMGSMETWAVRGQPAGCNKGIALQRLAARLGIEQTDVAAIGDWLNDVPMLEWAAASFAMGQAPEAVRAVSRHTLTATSVTGGGVAEAIDRWL